MKKRCHIFVSILFLLSALFFIVLSACTKKGEDAYRQLEKYFNEDIKQAKITFNNSVIRNQSTQLSVEYSFAYREDDDGVYLHFPSYSEDAGVETNYEALVRFDTDNNATYYFEWFGQKICSNELFEMFRYKNTFINTVLSDELDEFTLGDKDDFSSITCKSKFKEKYFTLKVGDEKVAELINEINEDIHGSDYGMDFVFHVKNDKIQSVSYTINFTVTNGWTFPGSEYSFEKTYEYTVTSKLTIDRSYCYEPPLLSEYKAYSTVVDDSINTVNTAFEKNKQMRDFTMTLYIEGQFNARVNACVDESGNITAEIDGYPSYFYSNGITYTQGYYQYEYETHYYCTEQSFAEFIAYTLHSDTAYLFDINKSLDITSQDLSYFTWWVYSNQTTYTYEVKDRDIINTIANQFLTKHSGYSFENMFCQFSINAQTGFVDDYYISLREDFNYARAGLTVRYSNINQGIDIEIPDYIKYGEMREWS